MREKISLLAPWGAAPQTKTLSETTVHDLGMDSILKDVTPKEKEQFMILQVMAKMTSDPAVTKYRGDVFDDIYRHPEMRESMLKILDQINFLRDYGVFKREYEEGASVWDLLHRLDDMMDYIRCVRAIYECLSKKDLHSEGLLRLRDYVDRLYHEHGFEELNRDVSRMKADTATLRSVTVGINLNDRFEAAGIGLISVNSRPFTKSGALSNFCDRMSGKDAVEDSTEWKENYKFHPFGASESRIAQTMERAAVMQNPMLGIAAIPKGDAAGDITSYMDRVTNRMLSILVKRLREMLNRYVSVTITDITDLIPEFIYYIRWAEYLEKLAAHGMHFCKAEIAQEPAENRSMHVKGLYNLKLASAVTEHGETIVANDLEFDAARRVYLLTGANRGGKTTITQAVGQLFFLAQGGIYVPAGSFAFHPADGIYTHFPADEDKTMDLGRLGEECRRFREIYNEATRCSLLLLNETFSTTSFEEGYYIARDSLRAILKKGIRTIYNTHMHKLALNLEEINCEFKEDQAASLVVLSEDGKRSFKVAEAPPQGQSFAHDIAVKYGVTFEMLTGQEAAQNLYQNPIV